MSRVTAWHHITSAQADCLQHVHPRLPRMSGSRCRAGLEQKSVKKFTEKCFEQKSVSTLYFLDVTFGMTQ
jgi:hypothetical protein